MTGNVPTDNHDDLLMILSSTTGQDGAVFCSSPVANTPVPFKIIQPIKHVETIASGKGVRSQKRLGRLYGKGFWRKRKGVAAVKLENGQVLKAELHWYEATGVGKKEFKIKRLLG